MATPAGHPQADGLESVVGRDVPRSPTQRAYAAVAAASAPALAALSSALRAPAKPCTPKPPTRTAGDTKYNTPPEQVEQALRELRANACDWAATPFARRAELARDCAARGAEVAEAATADAVAYKGSYEAGDSEEMMTWTQGPTLLLDLAHSFDLLAAGKRREPVEVRWRQSGGAGDAAPPQAVVCVFPATLAQHMLFPGYTGELWLRPGAAPAPGADARLGGPGELCAVMGAGNHALLAVVDVAHKCLVHGRVCILKMNPVNEWAGPHVEATLRPLIDANALRVVYGGADVGKALTTHAAVRSVHITGSDATYDAVVWGGGRKRAGVAPPLRKPVSAELGCVTPYVLVPGEWSDEDLHAKAADVAVMLASNASANCLAPKVLLFAKSWPQRDAFLAALRARLEATAPRHAFYPGSAEKYDALLKAYTSGGATSAQQLGAATAADGPAPRALPWLLLGPAPPSAGEAALTKEAWSPVLALRELSPENDVPAFLEAAAKTMNEQCWGTLSCSVYIDPVTQQAHAEAFENFLAALRYGAIGVNVHSVMVYTTSGLTWGGFPGHTPDDIGSGVGVVGNAHLYPDETVQKSVLRALWRRPSAGHGPAYARALTAYLAAPNMLNLVRVALRALRGS